MWYLSPTHHESREFNLRPYHHPFTRFLLPVLGITLFVAGATPAQTSGSVETSAWGSAPGLTEPHPDSKGRAGYWWWPKPEAAAQQERLAGNRGRVFGAWEAVEPAVLAVCETSPPIPTPQPDSIRQHLMINNILFAFDSTALSPEGRAEIERLAVGKKEIPYLESIRVVGHTDNVGSEAYNQDLGYRRARAVSDHLIAAGAEAEMLSIESRGESNPAVPNDSPVNRALNRRVEFEFEFK